MASGVALLSVLVLSACGGDSSTGSTDNAAAQSDAKPTSGGTIEYAHQQEVPCISGGWVEQAYTSRQVLDSLVSLGEDGKISPWLADSWTTSDDQLTWTFKLKSGVKFTDGTPLTASAAVKNFEYWLDPKTINGTVAAYIGSYYASSKAVDDQTFELRLAQPYSWLLQALAQGYFGIHSPKSLEAPADQQCLKPVGTGPFVVKEFNRGKNILFVKNPDYNSAPRNAKHEGPAYADALNWKFVKEPATRWGSLTTGQSDAIYDVPSVNWDAAEAKYDVKRYLSQGLPVTAHLNTVKGPFTDLRVRRALAYSLDREAAVKSAFGGAAEYSGNPGLSVSTPFFDKAFASTYTLDADKANALLDEAGWSGRTQDGTRTKDGKELTARVAYGAGSIVNADGVTVLQTLQEQAKATGFKLELNPYTLSQLFGGDASGPDKSEIFVSYWSGVSPAISSIVWRQSTEKAPNGSNVAYYDNPDLDAAVVDANGTSDPKEQQALYSKAQEILADQVPALGLYTRTSSVAVDPAKLRDVWLEGSTGAPDFHDAYKAN